MSTSLKQIHRIAAGMALAVAFSGAALAQQRCAPYDVLRYDLERDGLSFQSAGDVTDIHEDNNFEGHRVELYANQDTLRWTLMEIKDGEDPCFYEIGRIFFHEAPNAEDGERTQRQSALALHGNGDGSNAGFEFIVHEGTGRWFLTRLIGPDDDDITVVLAGDNYREENNPPKPPTTRINQTHTPD